MQHSQFIYNLNINSISFLFSFKIRGSLSLNDLKDKRVVLQNFLSKVIPSGLLNIEEFALKSNDNDDISIYIIKINDKINDFLELMKESKVWQNYILIYRNNNSDDNSKMNSDANDDKKDMSSNNRVGQNKTKGEKKTNDKKKSAKKYKK